jgi:hypothetical protein
MTTVFADKEAAFEAIIAALDLPADPEAQIRYVPGLHFGDLDFLDIFAGDRPYHVRLSDFKRFFRQEGYMLLHPYLGRYIWIVLEPVEDGFECAANIGFEITWL